MQRQDDTNARLGQTSARPESLDHGLGDLGGPMRRIALAPIDAEPILGEL